MNYIEISIGLPVEKRHLSEIVIAFLAEQGYESFSETEGTLNAYITEDLYNEKETGLLMNAYDLKFTKSIIEQQNWNKEWEENFQPIVVDEKLAIKAPFHNQEFKTQYTIIIEPKMSFGTGHHATTHMMCKLMGDYDFSESHVLDMGCGTGILAIYASILGASSACGIDIDEWSYENTVENAQRNNIDNIVAIQGDVNSIPSENFDFVFANINLNVLKRDMASYVETMSPSSILFLSGFFYKELDQIKEVCSKLGLLFVKAIEKDDWTACVFKK